MQKYLKLSFLQSIGVVIYISLVVTVMQNAERTFGKMNNYFGPMAFLLLFVLSAAITASLVLGRSILWYLDGQKKEAVKLFLFVLGWLFAFFLIILGINLVF